MALKRRGLVGASSKMLPVLEAIELYRNDPYPVVISGESGTGKELVAQALHRQGKFIPLDCAQFATDPGLFTSELFGHTRAAFTGASRDRNGLLVEAFGGTLFLDEIHLLNVKAQPKLLRLLQTGEYKKLGADTYQKAKEIKFVFATQEKRLEQGLRLFEESLGAKGFMKDLYSRMGQTRVRLPALRERPEDVPLLCEHFFHLLGDDPTRLLQETVDCLCDYSFRNGNVRELSQLMTYLSRTHKTGSIGAHLLPDHIRRHTEGSELFHSSYDEFLERQKNEERQYLLHHLRQARGRKLPAAKKLGISRGKLLSRISVLGLKSIGDVLK